MPQIGLLFAANWNLKRHQQQHDYTQIAMSIRRTTITAIGVIIGWMTLGTVQAAPIDRQQALQAARQFVTPRGKSITSTHPRALAPSHPRTSMADEAAYYVFDIDNRGGFVIIAGDDSVEPVIGYVEHGSFDADNMPDAMRWFLETFEESVNRGYVGTKVGGYENTTNANLAPSHPSTPAPSNTNLAPSYPRTPAPSNTNPAPSHPRTAIPLNPCCRPSGTRATPTTFSVHAILTATAQRATTALRAVWRRPSHR